MEHTLLAVDFVLIPESRWVQQAVEVSATLDPQRRIALHPEDVVPHLTLGMAVVGSDTLSALVKTLSQVAAELPLIELSISGLYQAPQPEGVPVVGWNLKKNAEIQSLHESLLDSLALHAQEVGSQASLLADGLSATPEAVAKTLGWIRHFPEGSILKNFQPHITLGYGHLEIGPWLGQGIRFPRLALYQLGTYCTCQKLLASVDLD